MDKEVQTLDDYDKTKGGILNFRQNVFIKTWCLYCSRRGKLSLNAQYAKNFTLLATIKSLQQFFGYYLAMKRPSECEVDIKVMLFQQQCRPLWQDWIKSGCLIFSFKNNNETQMSAANQLWQYLSFIMVGNQLDNDVIGLELSKREKLTLIQVWLRNDKHNNEIGNRLDASIRTDLPFLEKKMKGEFKMKYKDHRISISAQSTIKGAHTLPLHPKHFNNTF